MQLFITDDFDAKWSNIIYDERVFNQLRKVLRAKKGYQFCIQNNNLRYYITFESFDWGVVNWIVGRIEKIDYQFRNIGIATAILNKQDKMELICQKLTELWVERIIFFSAERSVVKKNEWE